MSKKTVIQKHLDWLSSSPYEPDFDIQEFIDQWEADGKKPHTGHVKKLYSCITDDDLLFLHKETNEEVSPETVFEAYLNTSTTSPTKSKSIPKVKKFTKKSSTTTYTQSTLQLTTPICTVCWIYSHPVLFHFKDCVLLFDNINTVKHQDPIDITDYLPCTCTPSSSNTPSTVQIPKKTRNIKNKSKVTPLSDDLTDPEPSKPNSPTKSIRTPLLAQLASIDTDTESNPPLYSDDNNPLSDSGELSDLQ